MRGKKSILLLILLYSCLYSAAQLIYPVVGTYNGKSAQGMFIYKDLAYIMNDGGICRVLNLKTGTIISNFMLGCSSYNPHVNTFCLGNEKSLTTNKHYIYVSETRNKYRCFVEQITLDSSFLIQTIYAMYEREVLPIKNWVVDRKNSCIYGLVREYKKQNEKGEYLNILYKFRLPNVQEGDVVLTENDIYEKYNLYFVNGIQGAKIKKSYMYLVTGREETAQNRIDAKRSMYIIDLKNKKIKDVVDISNISVNEPEDIDFYKNYILLYCGQNGGIYKIKKM